MVSGATQVHYEQHHLRFLLQTVAVFRRLQRHKIPLSICPHQVVNHWEWTKWKDEEQAAWRVAKYPWFRCLLKDVPVTPEGIEGVRPPFRLDAALKFTSTDANEYRTKPSSDLCVLADDDNAKKKCAVFKTHEVVGCCHRCPTDFLVRASDGLLQITVWQDFGPEGQVSDFLWQSHLPGPFLQADLGQEPHMLLNTWESGPCVVHRPGGVHEMYQNTPSAFPM